MNISAIDHLYAYNDGDNIIPDMGLMWANGETGLGLQQYWDPTNNKVIATDFSKHPALLFPKPYSSKSGTVVVPDTTGQQWYYNAITDEGGILSNGAVKDKYKNLFELTTVSQNGKTFPALKIKGNLATASDHTDKTIYYQSAYKKLTITCSKTIPIQESIGDTKKVLISTTGPDGSGDNVLSNKVDWVKFTPSLQLAGQTIAADKYVWQRYSEGAWKDITNTEKMTEIADNALTVYAAAVEGVDQFRCLVTSGDQTYIGVCEASDIHDTYYIFMGRNLASQAVGLGETVKYSPKVYDRSSGEESTGWTFTYSFTDNGGNAVTDLTKDNLTYENIEKYGGIATRIEANKATA